MASLLAAYCKPGGLLSKRGNTQGLAAGTTSAGRQLDTLLVRDSCQPARTAASVAAFQKQGKLEGHLMKGQAGKATHEKGDHQ